MGKQSVFFVDRYLRSLYTVPTVSYETDKRVEQILCNTQLNYAFRIFRESSEDIGGKQ